MTSTSKARTGFGPVRTLIQIAGAVAAFAAAPVVFPAPAAAATVAAPIPAGQDVDDFYKVRGGKPLWFQGGQPTAAAQELLMLLDSASIDGLSPAAYDTPALKSALQRASSGDRHAIKKADFALSKAFSDYARQLRQGATDELKYVDPSLSVGPPTPLRLLEMAAGSRSLKEYLADFKWMNPQYALLRRALVSGSYEGSHERDLLRINLERAKALPVGAPRYVVVNTATQRIYMYDGGRLTDSMKVVVGQQQADRKTPMMAGYLRYASLNPYWNVPPDLVWDDVGVHVKDYGLGYLKSRGYQVLSDWGDNPSVVDPTTVDWQAVKDGTIKIRVRQLPGPHNVLGNVKYTFTNPFGVYLHDTSAKELLEKDTRLFSGGCIRLEDATRFGTWLYGHQLHATSDDPDIKIPLERPVPVYVMYMTAVPDGSAITFLDDVYGWDAQQLAQAGPTGTDTLAGR